MTPENQHQLLDDIDTRQNEVLEQLDALNAEIELTIKQIIDGREETDVESDATVGGAAKQAA